MAFKRVEIDLDDFETKEIIKYLVDCGYRVYGNNEQPMEVDFADLEHIAHLATCGYIDSARDEAIKCVSRAIGKDLR